MGPQQDTMQEGPSSASQNLFTACLDLLRARLLGSQSSETQWRRNKLAKPLQIPNARRKIHHTPLPDGRSVKDFRFHVSSISPVPATTLSGTGFKML